MAKTLDEAGVKRLIQEIKGANKNLNTPIPISTGNTPESMAQNVKNIADYVEKAKAAGVDTTKSFRITLEIYGYSLEGIYDIQNSFIYGLLITVNGYALLYNIDVTTGEVFTPYEIVTTHSIQKVTSSMLDQGARNPIIITESTTEVDGETYQKLEEMADATDVVFRTNSLEFMPLIAKDMGNELRLIFGYTLCDASNLSVQNSTCSYVVITVETSSPYKVTIDKSQASLETILNTSGYLNKSTLSPVLQEIDLTGTDAERKAKLDKFAADWKDLTGASDLTGARFIAKGYFDIPSPPENNVIMTYVENGLVATGYTGIAITTYNSIIGAYRVNIALDGTMSSNAIKDLETTDAFQKFAWGEVPSTYLKITDAESTYETKTHAAETLTETLRDYAKSEEIPIMGNMATSNAITSIKQDLSPVLQEIDLIGTDVERKAKLDKFETDWKALTGASHLAGARFVGLIDNGGGAQCLLSYNEHSGYYSGISAETADNETLIKIQVSPNNGSLHITPLFSHLEAITIRTGNTTEDKAANKAVIEAYRDNLIALGVNVTKGFMIPVKTNFGKGFILFDGTKGEGYVKSNNDCYGILIEADYAVAVNNLISTITNYSTLNTTSKRVLPAINEINANAVHSDKLVPTLEAITIKTGNTPDDKAANVAAINAYVDNLKALGVDTTKGCTIPFVGSPSKYCGILFGRGDEYYEGVCNSHSTRVTLGVAINVDGAFYVTNNLNTISEYQDLTTIAKKIIPAINEVNALAKSKQDALTSGTNIKTVNGQSLLGSGDIAISGSGGSAPVLVDIDDITGSTGVSVPVDVFNKIANAASAKTPIFGYSKLVNGPRTTYEIIPLYVKNVSTTAGTNGSLSIQFIAENAYNSIGIMKSSDTECSISISSSRPFALDTSVDKSSTRGIQSSAVWNEIHSEPMTVNTATSGVTTLSSTDKHKILCYADSGTQQYNLPSSPVDGETFLFLKVKSGHAITIQSGTGNENIYDCSSGNSVVSKTIATSTKSKITVTYSSTVDKWLLMANDFLS